MKYYEDYLNKNNIKLKYIDYKEADDNFYKLIGKNEKDIEIYEPYDDKLKKKITKNINKLKINKSLNFLIEKDYFDKNKNLFYKNN